MTSPDNSNRWAQNVVKSGRATTARPAADGAAIAILTDGEEAYEYLHDSRNDSKMRVPVEFKSYYLSKRLPDTSTSDPKFLPGTRLYHEHLGDECPLGLNKVTQLDAAQQSEGVAPSGALKTAKKRKRGSRGRKK